MRIPKKSIARRLIVAVLGVELASSLLVIVVSLGYERHTHFRAFDTMLRGRADSVLGAVQDAEDADDNVMLDRADLRLPARDIYEVFDERGRLLGRSPLWPDHGLASSSPADLAMAPDNRITSVRVLDGPYRLLVVHGTRIVDPGEPGGGKLHRVTVLYGAPTEPVWRAIRSAVSLCAAGSLLLLAVTGGLIAWLFDRGLEPLRQLAALAHRVSINDWQFSPPQSARTTAELAPLTEALESVLNRLEAAFVQQRTFVSDAAHELKTAVAVAKSSLQLLSLRPRTPGEYAAGLERCLSDSERLEELVAKMLTLARVETGSSNQTPPPERATNLAACLRRAAAQLETLAALRRVEVRISSQGAEDLAVPVSCEDCSLLVSNLLLNALEHSPPDSVVHVRASLFPASGGLPAQFTVEDHGEGIEPAALPHVFDRFYRGDPSRTRSTGGTGLGLAIAKAIVDRAGGSIELTSVVDKGTTVAVHLPQAKTIAANRHLSGDSIDMHVPDSKSIHM
jgi:signal transduction histidine kinase